MRDYLKSLFATRAQLLYLGFAIPQLWVAIFYQESALLSFAPQSFFFAGQIVCILIAVIWFFFRPRAKTSSWLMWLSAFAMSLVPLSLLVPGGQSEVLACVAIFLGGAGRAWCFLLWANLYTRIPLRDALGYIFLSTSCVAAIRFIFSWMPPEFSNIITATIMLVSLAYPLFLGYAIKSAQGLPEVLLEPKAGVGAMRPGFEAGAGGASGAFGAGIVSGAGGVVAGTDVNRVPQKSGHLTTRQIVITILELVVFALLLGTMRSVSHVAQSQNFVAMLIQALNVAIPLIFLVWIANRSRSQNTILAVQSVLLLIIISLLAIAFLGENGELVAMALVSVSRNVILLLLLWVLLELAHTTTYHPFVVFGLGRGLYALGVYVGVIINEVSGVFSASDTFNLNLALFILICIILMLSIRSMRAMKGLVAPEEQSVQEVLGAIIDERCEVFRGLYSLTDREIEIAQYLCKGRTVKYIAETLVISENTVRTHAKSLYKKLNIHSRQELLTRVGV